MTNDFQESRGGDLLAGAGGTNAAPTAGPRVAGVSFRHACGKGRQVQAIRGTRDICGMQQKTIQTLYAYWNEMRAGRLAPLRLEIEPSRIAGILSETFMLERIDAATYQYRLAGTRLCEVFGSELRGRNFLDDWSETDRHVLTHDLVTVCEQGAVAVVRFEGASNDSRHRVELEAVLLPLVHAGQRIGRIIGAMSATSTPHWLVSEPLLSRRLQRHEIV